MRPTFDQLRNEYEHLLDTVVLTRRASAEKAARDALLFRARYDSVSRSTGVPIMLLAALHMRESDFDFRTNLAQGDPLTHPSIHVPAGRPKLTPGMKFPVTWEYAAVDALEYDGLANDPGPWTMPYLCYKAEAWNGFGPRNHGIHTGYLWAGTNHYVRGKYVADGKWASGHVDTQLGVVPLVLCMVRYAPDLAPPGMLDALGNVHVPPTSPDAPVAPPGAVVALSASDETRRIQRALNTVGIDGTPLVVDGSYGRRTVAAVRAFQKMHGLVVDGIVGPMTRDALAAAAAGPVDPASAAKGK